VINILEGLEKVTALVLLFCSYVYLRQLKKKRKEGKLSKFEITMYIITGLATFLYAISYFLLFLDNLLNN
jgi:uncharacterized protein with PQ loop repeat